jgi:molecular chaperone DnaK
VHVSAKDTATGREQRMTVTGGSALNKDDIDRMVRDAEEYADADRARREEVEARNSADSLAYQTEKFMTDNDDKIGEDAKTEVKGKLDDLKQALEGTDIEAIKTAQSALSEASQKMGAAMYAAQQAAGASSDGSDGTDGTDGASANGASADGSGDEDVVDAEIVDESKDEANR